ncbi:MAG: hypothetical protein JO314_04610 [Acidobacteria bacterium]|nr:hypothetical protein [Acidobacteriota bacterium]
MKQNEIDAAIHARMQKAVHLPDVKRAVEEEFGPNGGLTRNQPERHGRESDTYWHTRLLFHTILGLHYKTPQYNLELWDWYIQEYLPEHIRIRGKNFSAGTEKNLKFYTSDGDFSFNAHEEIDPNRFLGRFGLRGKVKPLIE